MDPIHLYRGSEAG
jgi:hypothetical protein